MSTSQQRREAERRRLQDQLDERRAREAARKRFRIIASIVTTLVVLAAIVVVVVVATSGSDDDKKSAGGGGGSTVGSTVTFQGVTVGKANDVQSEPKLSAKGTTDPASLQYKDLVVGSGKAASPSATVTVHYKGVLYKNGTQFDSSWSNGEPAQFSLAQVVPGFTQGIGGNDEVPPMKVGGRRLMILPPALGYGAQANGAIPANSTLVFVVDLKSVDG